MIREELVRYMVCQILAASKGIHCFASLVGDSGVMLLLQLAKTSPHVFADMAYALLLYVRVIIRTSSIL